MNTDSIQLFKNRYQFSPQGGFLVGVERESHILDDQGNIAPLAHTVLKELGDPIRFGYELSACQLEERTLPCKNLNLEDALRNNERDIAAVEKKLGFSRSHKEVAPETMPLDVYPDPTGRYQDIVKRMPRDVLAAACRVIGTHIHIGMPDHETALRAYNHAVEHHNVLCEMGDGSNGERLQLYKLVAGESAVPKKFETWEDLYEFGTQQGFLADPRKCWSLIRMSVHGTIEFRMFGATESIEQILLWAKRCHTICNEVA